MRKPYILKKRPDSKYYSYKLSTENTYHSTRCTTKAKADKYVQDLIYGIKSKSEDIQIKEFIADMFIPGKCKFLNRMQKRGKEVTTIMSKMRRGYINNHILPYFGERLLNSITSMDIEEWLIQLPLMNKTKNHILATIRIIFNEACLYGYIEKDPVLVLKNFPNNSEARDILYPKEVNSLFAIEESEIENIWYNMMWYSFFSTLLYTGARLSEIRALTWKDWNKDFNVITIDKSVKEDKTIGSTKNGHSRIIPVVNDLKSILEKWYLRSYSIEDTDLIFSVNNNKPLSRKCCHVRFKKALAFCKINLTGRKVVIHSLRHTANTYFRRFLNDENLRLITGHLDPKMTDLYDHPSVADEINKVILFRKEMEDAWLNKDAPLKNTI